MKIKNNIKKVRQIFAISAAVMVAAGGIAILNQKTYAAELPAGSLISNFVHPDIATATAGSSFTFSADVASGATSCEFYSGQSGSGSSDPVTPVSGSVSYTDTLTNGRSYGFQCYNASGDYDSVKWLFGTPNPDKPTAPTLIAGYPKLNADGSVTLKWNPSTDSNGIARYDVLVNNGYDPSSAGYNSTVINLDGATTEYTFPLSAYSSWETSASNRLEFMIYVYDNYTPMDYNNSGSVSVSLKSDNPIDNGGQVTNPSNDDSKNLIAPNTGIFE